MSEWVNGLITHSYKALAHYLSPSLIPSLIPSLTGTMAAAGNQTNCRCCQPWVRDINTCANFLYKSMFVPLKEILWQHLKHFWFIVSSIAQSRGLYWFSIDCFYPLHKWWSRILLVSVQHWMSNRGSNPSSPLHMPHNITGLCHSLFLKIFHLLLHLFLGNLPTVCTSHSTRAAAPYCYLSYRSSSGLGQGVLRW